MRSTTGDNQHDKNTVVIVLLLNTHASMVVGHLDNQLKGRRPAELGYPGSIRGYSTSATQDFCIRTSENAVPANFGEFMRFLRFLRNDLSVKTSDGSRWLDQVKDAYAQSKSSSKLPSLCSTQPHIRGPPTNPSLLLWRGQPVCRGSCRSSPRV
jgi:hypothetical protein